MFYYIVSILIVNPTFLQAKQQGLCCLKNLIRPKVLVKFRLYSVLTNFSIWYWNFNFVKILIYRFMKVSKPQAKYKETHP